MDDERIREVYARFGLAYYHSECLHRELCMILALSDLPAIDLVTRPMIEERLSKANSLTLGEVIARLKGKLPLDLYSELNGASNRRNFLAHHFWFQRIPLLYTTEGVGKVLDELDEFSMVFDTLDAKLSTWAEPRRLEIGLTESVVSDRLERIFAGEVEEPLAERQTLKEMEQKLSRSQRLIKVWEFALGDGKKPLIFELADRSLWQLCDVGLGWTRFKEVAANWIANVKIMQFLPADIIPRPKGAKPWNYEFALAESAVLWVKPGRQLQSFVWGIRKPN